MAKRKISENSLKNLKPITERTKKEQRKIQSQGGKKRNKTNNNNISIGI